MNRSILSEPSALDGCPRCLAIKIDGPNRGYHNVRNMPPSTRRTAAFSLVEVTLALGVAAICLLVLLGLLPDGLKDSTERYSADDCQPDYFTNLFLPARGCPLPPGQTIKVCPDPPDPNDPCDWSNLNGHWLRRSSARHDVFHERRKANWELTAVCRQTRSSGQRSRTWRHQRKPLHWQLFVLRWPAAVDPDNGGVPAGSVTTLLAVNR